MKAVLGIVLAIGLAAVVFYFQQGTPFANDTDVHASGATKSLPAALKEISGIALTPDGRLFGHADEKGMVAEIDTATGEVTNTFYLGRPAVREDFEDIEIVGEVFYLVTSSGDLYEFKEGNDGDAVKYREYETLLHSGNDVEGLCYDATVHALLLACKGDGGSDYKKQKAIYGFPLATKQLIDRPRFLFSAKLPGWNKDFSPSAIARNPVDGNFYLLSSTAKAMLVMNADGSIKDIRKLPKDTHNQPEGLVFLPDGSFFISDEGGSGTRATLTRYPPRSWESWSVK